MARICRGLILSVGILAAAAWADEMIEMGTYIPTPSSSETAMDRLRAGRAAIGGPYAPKQYC